MYKVIIIDDDKIVRDSLISILKAQNYAVLGSGKNSEEALALYQKHSPEIVLMDIRMGNSSGLEAAQKIIDLDPEAKILLVSTFHDQEYIDKAMQIGCKGYILKENIAGISSAIKTILSGKVVYDNQVIENLIARKLKPSTDTDNNPTVNDELSLREKEIIKAVADGLNNKEIAEQLHLSEGTVRNYISTILSKLELRDRTQLAIYYFRQLQ